MSGAFCPSVAWGLARIRSSQPEAKLFLPGWPRAAPLAGTNGEVTKPDQRQALYDLFATHWPARPDSPRW